MTNVSRTASTGPSLVTGVDGAPDDSADSRAGYPSGQFAARYADVVTDMPRPSDVPTHHHQPDPQGSRTGRQPDAEIVLTGADIGIADAEAAGPGGADGGFGREGGARVGGGRGRARGHPGFRRSGLEF